MSRLYGDPLYGPQAMPGADSFYGVPGVRRRRGLPAVDPAEADATLSTLAEDAVGGLGYVGKLLDKTFGGRAVRGLLGGAPRELLSVLPLSDTLGITDERDAVYGRQLLENAGVLRPDDDPNSFGWGDAAGVAAEIALDPATYLGFGTLTRAGDVARRAAGLGRTGTAQRLAGFAARESDVAAAAANAGVDLPTMSARLGYGTPDAPLMSRAVEDMARAEGVTIQPRFLVDAAGTAADNPERATPLAGALGVGIPFLGKTPILTEGPLANAIARGLPAAVSAPVRAVDATSEYLTGFSPRRAARQLFDTDVKGMYDPRMQALAEQVTTPREQALRAEGMAQYARTLNELDPLLAGKTPAEVRTAMRLGRAAAEQAAADPALLAAGDAAFGPAGVRALQAAGDRTGQITRALATPARDLGVDIPDLVDASIQYMTRQKDVLPRRPGESVFSYVARSAKEYSARNASMNARLDLFKDLPGGTDQINSFVRDPMMSGRSSPMTELQIGAAIRADIAARGVTVTKELHAKSEALAKFLKTLPDDYAKTGRGYFSDDLPADMLAAINRTSASRAAAETFYEAVGRFSRPLGTEAGDVPLDRVLGSAALTGRDANGASIALQKVGERLGIGPNDVARYGVPAEIASDLRRLNQAWENPAELKPVLAAWDAFGQLFKTHLTAPFVAFHTRNAATGLFNMWRNDALDMGALADGYKVVRGEGLAAPLPGMRGANPTAELYEELIGNGVAYTPRPSQLSDVVGTGGEQILRRPNLPRNSGKGLAGDAQDWLKGFVPKSLAEANPLNVQGVGRDEDVFTWVKQMRAAGQSVDDWTRVSHYLALRRKGYNPAAAALEVKKYQLDYTDLTNFERQAMKRVVPWYSYTRRNLPPILEDLATNPAKLAGTTRVVTRGRTPGEYTPAYVAEGAAIPVPGGGDGTQRYIRSFGLPVEDEAVKTIGNLLHGDVQRAGQSLLGMTVPQIRVPAEQVFGVQLMSGRPLHELRPSPTLQAAAGGNEQVGRWLTQLLNASPLSRVGSTVDRVVDERKPLWLRGINVTTGVNVGDVDVAVQRDADMQRMLERLLTGHPGVRRQQGVYLNADAVREGRVAPEDLRLYAMYLDAQARTKAANEARRAQQQAGISPR